MLKFDSLKFKRICTTNPMLPPDLLHYICQFLGTQEELTRLRWVGKAFLKVINKQCLTYWKGHPRYDLPNLQWLDCSYQGLTQLIVPAGLRILKCSGNQLTQLTVPAGLRDLNCSYNQLTQLTVPEGVRDLNCSRNQLTQLTVPPSLRHCDKSNNPFHS